jgi:hypothetical protein
VQDSEILDRIQGLVEQQHVLRSEGHADAARLAKLDEAIDQCWDLLRQRQAREEFGLDPEAVHARDTSTVEGYQQ